MVDRLNDLADKLHVGHLMVLCHFGNMPKETTLYNTTRFAKEMIPRMRDRFGEWEDKWWPRDREARRRRARAARRSPEGRRQC